MNARPEFGGSTAPAGQMSSKAKLHLVGAVGSPIEPGKGLPIRRILQDGLPRLGLSREVNRYRSSNLLNLWRGLWRVAAARSIGVGHLEGALYLCKIVDGKRVELGLASLRVVTTAGVNFLVDALQNIVEPELLKFHGLGTGGTAEAVGDTALVTELTTQYNPDNTRATGSLGEGASANIYRTVGTNTVDAAAAVTEHGIFSQAATGGGTLLDRSLFSVINLASGNSLETTYDLTLVAGS